MYRNDTWPTRSLHVSRQRITFAESKETDIGSVELDMEVPFYESYEVSTSWPRSCCGSWLLLI